jgi:DNA-binding response OmpR family regulator
MPVNVLVVDDDEKILKVLTAYLQREGYTVATSRDGVEAVELENSLKPDVVLLDVMLPGQSGWEACKQIRNTSKVPILMLTARDGETDRVIGLEIGADDYVVKPFSPREVIARIRAILRRVQPEGHKNPDEQVLLMGDLCLNMQNRTVTVKETPVELTPTEYKLLELFLAHPGQVFSRLQLIERVQGYAFEGYERTVDSHIKNLRKKLGGTYGESRYIKTVYGVGYKLAGEGHA